METDKWSRSVRVALVVVVVLGLSALGCGSGGPRTYPVNGKIDLGDADVAVLTGSVLEAAHESNPAVRASGEIRPDGSFTLQTLHEGVLRHGAQEGSYRVRIVLNDDDRAARKRASHALARRYLSFDTSGLSIQVPTSTEVTLKVGPR